MKKIAFFVQWMLCGGVENALISLSNKLIEMGNEVTIYVIEEKGEFIQKVPPKVKLMRIPMEEKVRKSIPVGGTKVTVRECLEKKDYIRALWFTAKHKLNRTPFAELNINLNRIPLLEERYDIAVNFHLHSPFLVWYLSERVVAEKKFTWIHNDFSTTKYEINTLQRYLCCVDRFFAVSEQLKKEFVVALPEFESKTEVALNIVPVSTIKQRATEFYPEEYTDSKELKVLTVGRLEEQKGYDLAIEVCKRLCNEGYDFKWYVLGEGTLKNELTQMIEDNGLAERFYLLGSRMNPYPYFKNCDIYVQTSRHEGYVTTVTEAKIFCKPIATTDVSGAKEQINDGLNGEIAEINVDSIYSKIKKLIINETLRIRYADTLKLEKPYSIGDWINYFE